MSTYSEYDSSTGWLTGNYVETDIEGVSPRAREGFSWVDGAHNHDTHRVVEGVVTEEQRPAPTVDHVWNGTTSHWELSAEKESALALEAWAKGIAWDMETGRQARAVRELILNGFDQTSEAWTILNEVEADVVSAMVEAGLREPEEE